MPYIGKDPVIGEFIELDALTASATADYVLTRNGAAYKPATVNNLLVSINGVIQGGSTMSLNGNTLTVGATLSSSDTIDFVRVLGSVGNVSEPTDGSVTSAKLASGAVTSAKLANDIAVNTLDVATIRASNGTTAATIDSSGRILQPTKPAFNVFYSGGSFEMAANTIFPLNTARVNVGSYFNLSTYKFTAPVSGTYFFSFRSMTNEQNTRIILYINGSSAEYLVYEDGGGTDWHPTHGDTIRTLSANDTVNIFNATSYSATMHGNEYNAFCGHLIG